jgi:hypothetical protein
MTQTPDPEPEDEAAFTAPDQRDRRRRARRGPRDRRAGTTPPAGVERRVGDRRASDRRHAPSVPDLYRANVRSINEYPLDADELEFINTVNAYKQRHQRPFPTWSEVLHVLRFLGYRKTGAMPGGSPSAVADVDDADDDAADDEGEGATGSPGDVAQG